MDHEESIRPYQKTIRAYEWISDYMRTYWYVSLNNKYPLPMKGQHKRVVMSIQMMARYSIVEMIREATPVEIDKCKLVYCGHGYWKDDHVQKNIGNYI